MVFSALFEVIAPLPACEIKTFKARERGTGREVLVHLIPRSALPESSLRFAEVLLRRCMSLPDQCRDTILKIGEYEDARYIYVATEVPPDAGSGNWLSEFVLHEAGHAPTLAVPVDQLRQAAKEAEASRQQGDSTSRILERPPQSARPAFSGMFAGPLGREAPAAERNSAPSQASGEFTRIFSAPRRAPDDALPPSPSAPKGPAASSSPEIGEFTQFFSNPLAGHTDSHSAEAGPIASPRRSREDSPVAEPGAFTKVFRSPQRARAPISDDLSTSESPPSRDASGTFTTLFPQVEHSDDRRDSAPLSPLPKTETPSAFNTRVDLPSKTPLDEPLAGVQEPATQAPTAPKLRSQNSGGFVNRSGEAATQLFRSPARSEPAKEPARDAGPSEFTRIIAMPRRPEQASAQPPQTSEPPAQVVPMVVPDVRMNAGSISMPSMSAPSFQAPSISGSSISGGSFSAPSLNPGSFSAPSVSAPSLSTPSAPAIVMRAPAGGTDGSSRGDVSISRPLLWLILTGTVLLMLALGLIVYFAATR